MHQIFQNLTKLILAQLTFDFKTSTANLNFFLAKSIRLFICTCIRVYFCECQFIFEIPHAYYLIIIAIDLISVKHCCQQLDILMIGEEHCSISMCTLSTHLRSLFILKEKQAKLLLKKLKTTSVQCFMAFDSEIFSVFCFHYILYTCVLLMHA